MFSTIIRAFRFTDSLPFYPYARTLKSPTSCLWGPKLIQYGIVCPADLAFSRRSKIPPGAWLVSQAVMLVVAFGLLTSKCHRTFCRHPSDRRFLRNPQLTDTRVVYLELYENQGPCFQLRWFERNPTQPLRCPP